VDSSQDCVSCGDVISYAGVDTKLSVQTAACLVAMGAGIRGLFFKPKKHCLLRV
jgi:hypothetical protein